MVWAFRISAVVTAVLILSAAALLTRAFLGFAGKDAAIAGLILTAVAMVTAGITGYLYSTTRYSEGDAERGGGTDHPHGREHADSDAKRSGGWTLTVGLIGVAGFGIATVYGLAAEGEVGPVTIAGLLLSALNVGVAFLTRRRD